MRSRGAPLAVAAIVAFSALTSAQGGGKPVTGNPTPGTAQPDPPNLANQVTVTGCVQLMTRRAEASASAKASADQSGSAKASADKSASADPNTPSNSRFELVKVERASSKTYRLQGIDSQFSPFVGAKVEISGEITRAADAGPPTLIVQFVQRSAGKC